MMNIEKVIDFFKSLTLDRIVGFNPWVKLSIFISFTIILILVGNTFWIGSQRSAVIAAQNQEANLKRQYVTLLRNVKTLPELENQVSSLEYQYSELLAQLPEGRELPRLIEELSDIAHQRGLIVRTLTPSPLQHLKEYSILNVRLLVEGTYKQVTELLIDIAQMPRIMIVKDYRVVPMSANNRSEPLLQVTLNLQTYSLSPDQRQNATARR